MKNPSLLMVATILLSACQTEVGNELLFDTANADKEVLLSNDEDAPKCAVHLQLQYASEKNGEKAEIVNNAIEEELLEMRDISMKHAVDSFVQHYTDSYIRNFLPLYNQDRADTTKRFWYEYHYVITSQTYSGYKGTSVYVANIDYYEGGAHGVNQQQTFLFDNKSGRRINISDVFVPGYENRLNAILLKSLREKTGVKNGQELHAKGYLTAVEMYPSKNFILNDETITFIYNPSEIASYDKGSVELTISLSAIQDILSSDYRL